MATGPCFPCFHPPPCHPLNSHAYARNIAREASAGENSFRLVAFSLWLQVTIPLGQAWADVFRSRATSHSVVVYQPFILLLRQSLQNCLVVHWVDCTWHLAQPCSRTSVRPCEQRLQIDLSNLKQSLLWHLAWLVYLNPLGFLMLLLLFPSVYSLTNGISLNKRSQGLCFDLQFQLLWR